MRIVLSLITLVTLSIHANETFHMGSQDTVCGLNASMQQEEQLFQEAFESLEAQCLDKGFKGVKLSEVAFRTLPHSWGTIGCTPISSLTVSGIKECF